jgi:hypothetical protein
MPKRIPKRFHIDCADCNKHYCLKSLTSQVFLMAAHRDCATFSSLGPNKCSDDCITEDQDASV